MKSQPKKTLIIIAIGLSLLNIYFKNIVLIIIPILLLIIALTSQKTSYWIEQHWFKLSQVIGYISNRLILGVVFFIILTPIAILYRLFHKNKTSNQNQFNNYKDSKRLFKADDLKNTW
ncbi:MAG: SxtJ family membrane protein [Bacteroidota bacterium]|nr:SxtJ family membrane protein [Bacteroidota bacterium]